MKVVKSTRGLKTSAETVLTLGNFDGLHRGHAKILTKLVKRAASLGMRSVVYTFDPHPMKVVAPERSPKLLLSTEDKIDLIAGFGVDYLVLARFTREFAALHPREFVTEEIVPLRVREISVGHDFTFGRARSGTAALLKKLGAEFGFAVSVVPAYNKGGSVISSSRIRGLVAEGRVREAATLLGRDYSIKGRVVKGDDRGRGLGFPTANLKVTSELMPGDGVYAARVSHASHGRALPAVVNIGIAPTFTRAERMVEAHILDFRGDIYGKRIEVSFVRRLRGERVFKTKEALAKRIAKDVERARGILG